jgi:MoxR-like ATPase
MNTTPTTDTADMAACWQDFHAAIEHGAQRVLLYGVPGTGKTTAGMKYGTNGKNAYRLTCTSDMTDAELVGTWRRVRDSHTYTEGVGVLAWREGARLVVDEVDKASGDVLGTLLNLLDSPESAQWRNPDSGDMLTPAATFSAVATTNCDDLRDLPEALVDRFTVCIRVNEPHPDALARLPHELRGLARVLCDRPEGERASLRAFLEYTRLIVNGMNTEQAARLVFGHMAHTITEAQTAATLGTK